MQYQPCPFDFVTQTFSRRGVHTNVNMIPVIRSSDSNSAFSPFKVGSTVKKSLPPDMAIADMRPSMMHGTVAAYLPSPTSLNGYLPPEIAMYHWASHRDTILSHKLLAYHPGFANVAPYHSGEGEKPNQSYIGLIGKAILSSPQKKLVLSDIYNYILSNHPYFRNKGPGWRNSIRHNLSLNECFVKVGRSPNGKGHFWAINPVNYEDFSKGEYRKKRAQRRTRNASTKTVPGVKSYSAGKDAIPKEPASKPEEKGSAGKPTNSPCSRERLTQKDTENRGFHIETLLSDSKDRPSERSAFTSVVPHGTLASADQMPTSSAHAVSCGNSLYSTVFPCSHR